MTNLKHISADNDNCREYYKDAKGEIYSYNTRENILHYCTAQGEPMYQVDLDKYNLEG